MDTLATEMDPEYIVEQLISEYDKTVMPLPDIEFEPQLLISKVRKHYMDYVIKLLTGNYESNQKLMNKNIYLPSAIWRCAKKIETHAAQTCMVAQLYRKNIVTVIKELKNDTKKGKLNKRLYECLHKAPENEKKSQTTLKPENCNCQCSCGLRKRPRKVSESPHNFKMDHELHDPLVSKDNVNGYVEQYEIPVIIDSHVENQQSNIITPVVDDHLCKIQLVPNSLNQSNINISRKPSISVESQDSDEIMMQLEKIFEAEPNDDDLFDGALCDTTDSIMSDDNAKKRQTENCDGSKKLIDNHSAQIKSLDERLASLAGLLVSNTEDINNTSQEKPKSPKNKKPSKWVCEEYYRKTRFFELLNDIGDDNMRKLARIKAVLVSLFGDDSDDDGIITPLDDQTPEFVKGCKERIASMVVKTLSSYYNNGQIRGKELFKALAKHLIKLIYKCQRFPHEHEVKSFLEDFMAQHKTIKCETDLNRFTLGMEPFKI